MKRIACIIICCVILTSFCSCQCKHLWEDATCITPSYCSKCGETQGEALGHTVGIGKCSKCILYSYALRAEATEITNIMTKCINETTNLGEHLVEYSIYSSDTYKRLAVAEAFADLSVGVTKAFIELAEKSKEHSEFAQIEAYSIDALTVIYEVLEYYESGFTNHGLWEKMYDAFNKLIPIIEDINDEIEEWHL